MKTLVIAAFAALAICATSCKSTSTVSSTKTNVTSANSANSSKNEVVASKALKTTNSNSTQGTVMKGGASYYADKYEGRKTANGEIFSQKKFTAAHKTLKFGTVVKVTNQENNKSVEVRINDRGPYVSGRIIDLTRAAAEAIDMVKSGVAQVTVEVIKEP